MTPLRFLSAFWLTFCLATILHAAPPPPALAKALDSFHTEGTPGWGFVQSTVSATEKSLVERFEPAKPDFTRWTLLKKDGRDPTPEETKDYSEKQTRRTHGGQAPDMKKQLDLDSCTLIKDDGTLAVYRFRLKAGGDDDTSAAHMACFFTLHQPSGSIAEVELSNIEPFSPVFTVKVVEARTRLTYSQPADGQPVLLQKVEMRMRGTAMWFRSMDNDLTITYSDYTPPRKR